MAEPTKDGVAASGQEPGPAWIPRDTDEKPSDAMPTAGLADWREQAEWWQRTAIYWCDRAQELMSRG